MLKEKREKNKNAGESKNKSNSGNSSQNTGSSEPNATVKEEKSETGDGGPTAKKEPTEGRKSVTPVKTEPGTQDKEGAEVAVKSEVRTDSDGASPAGQDIQNIKQENEGGTDNDNFSGPSPVQQQQQQQQNTSSKQCNNSEYMQQQSQIFVFTTVLANAGAEAVANGQYQSIVAFHCAQKGTKDFLKQHPLKHAQFNRQNQSQWMATMSATKNKQIMRGNPQNLKGHLSHQQQQQQHHMNISQQQQQQQSMNNQMSSQQQSTAAFLNPSMEDLMNGSADEMSAWEQQAGNLNLDSLAQNGDVAVNNLLDDPDSFLGSDSHLNDGGGNPMSPNFGQHASLQGVKIPDENLTPQQRMHREEKLGTLSRLQKMFLATGDMPVECQGMNPSQQMQLMNQMQQQSMMQQQQQNCGGGGGGPGMPRMPHGGMMDGPRGMLDGPPLGGGGMPRGVGYRPPMMQMCDGPGGMMDGGMNCGSPIVMSGGQMIDNINQMQGGQMSGGMMMPKQGMDWNRQQIPPGAGQMGPGPGGQNNPNFKKLQPGQGPPPPYHQTTRSASVPIATQSPNPSSPNNPNPMSLPSPRAYSTSSNMNSPADASRLAMKGLNQGQSPSHDSPNVNQRNLVMSNPSTPMSAHLSPSTSLKDVSDATTTNEGKEPNLMPVPSPQQIQYLNTFEGQELTIQKQPNTGVKESPPGSAEKKNPSTTPTSQQAPGGSNPSSMTTNFPVPSSPSTVNPTATNDKSNKQQPGVNSSPTTQAQLRQIPVSEHQQQQQGNVQDLFPGQHNNQGPQGGGFPGGPMPGMQGKPNFPNERFFQNCSPGGPFPPCSRADNVPLNPNSSIPPPSKVSHFDPISQLAQMSQQLNERSGLGGNPSGGGGMMGGMPHAGSGAMMGGGFNNVMPGEMMPGDCMPAGANALDCGPMGPMGGGPMSGGPMGPMGPRSMSPGKMGGGMPPNFGPPVGMQRMLGRPPVQMGPGGMFNGANVQVKPGASNTIQYLPQRPQMGAQNAPPRGPPNLEFLSRYAGPMNNNPMNDGNGGAGLGPGGMPPRMQNMQYFQPNHPNHPGNFNPGMDGSDMVSDGGMPPGMGGPGGPGSMMMGNQMMRPMRAQLRMPMGGGPMGPGGPGQHNFQNPGGPPNSNPFGHPKMTPDGHPLPPNYAQQYQNFQQQLYASNSRGQLGGQQAFFAPK